MSVRCLVDTNVLIYSVDPRNAQKSQIANSILERFGITGTAVTTSQVITEFYSATTRAHSSGQILPPSRAASWLADWFGVATFAEIDRRAAQQALRAAYSYNMNIYDAQMWAVATVHRIPILLTEDAQFSDVIEGVRYVNPFDEAFVLADLGL